MSTGPDTFKDELRSEGPQGPRRSRRILALAIVSTVIAVLFLGHTLSVMFRDVSPGTTPVTSSPASSGDELVIAVGRTPGGQSEWSSYVVLMKHVQDRLGRPVRLHYVADREEADEVFERGEADAGFVCTRSYLLLRSAGIVRELVVPITSGASTETAMVLVRADSTARTLDDLKGHSVGVSSRTSVSGASYLFWLADAMGFEVRDFFGAIIVSSTQEESLRKLERGEVDSAVGCSTEVKEYPDHTFRSVSVSPEYALPPFVVASSLDTATVDALRQALLDFDASARLPESSVLGGFMPVAADAYAFSAELLEFIPDEIEHQ
ncbi:MAG: phosphate/phosphite/phosphonate ABC transporter substrate-binding protein [Coriobacteriia bacterium]